MISLIGAVQLMLADWHNRPHRQSGTLKRLTFQEYVTVRAGEGFEPAIRLVHAEGLPAADSRPRIFEERGRDANPDVLLLEYAQDMLDAQWDEDRKDCDSSTEAELAWTCQNRLRALLGLRELHTEELRATLGRL